jgi:hypothetical protein
MFVLGSAHSRSGHSRKGCPRIDCVLLLQEPDTLIQPLFIASSSTQPGNTLPEQVSVLSGLRVFTETSHPPK